MLRHWPKARQAPLVVTMAWLWAQSPREVHIQPLPCVPYSKILAFFPLTISGTAVTPHGKAPCLSGLPEIAILHMGQPAMHPQWPARQPRWRQGSGVAVLRTEQSRWGQGGHTDCRDSHGNEQAPCWGPVSKSPTAGLRQDWTLRCAVPHIPPYHSACLYKAFSLFSFPERMLPIAGGRRVYQSVYLEVWHEICSLWCSWKTCCHHLGGSKPVGPMGSRQGSAKSYKMWENQTQAEHTFSIHSVQYW